MTEDLQKTRERIRALKQELHDVRLTPLPPAEAMRRAQETLRQSASALRLNLRPFIFDDGQAELDLGTMMRQQPAALLSSLLADALLDRIEGQLNGAYQQMRIKPMTAVARRKKLDALEVQLLEAEIAEERAIRAQEAEGEDAARREDADVRAVLMMMEG